jgi:cytochrome c-type biogenesis protein CcmH/NrfF
VRSILTSLFRMKAAQAVVVALAVFFAVGATDANSRYNDLGHRLMCTCGCAQILAECNHVGCQTSEKGRAELIAMIAQGKSDQQILDAFAAKYGATVLAAPPARGFDLVAWIAPFAVFLAATIGTVLLVRRWADARSKAQPAGMAGAEGAAGDALREKIRRETGGDGEF